MKDYAALFQQAQGETLADVERLRAEIELVKAQIVVPGWGGENHGMPRTLYGYMMNCFSLIDLLSQYWQGGKGAQGQTKRIAAFMDRYMDHEAGSDLAAVQIWRHTLMHTGNPYAIVGKNTGIRYRWLLHWGAPHLPIEQHMTFQRPGSSEWIINVGLSFLAQDLIDAARALFREAQQDQSMMVAIAKVEKSLAEQRIADL